MVNTDRLINLEARIAHQDQTIEQLGEELFRQQKQLTQVEATCQYLLERFKSLPDDGGLAAKDDERPPHY